MMLWVPHSYRELRKSFLGFKKKEAVCSVWVVLLLWVSVVFFYLSTLCVSWLSLITVLFIVCNGWFYNVCLSHWTRGPSRVRIESVGLHISTVPGNSHLMT